MNSWHTIIAEAIASETRQDAAECVPAFQGYGETGNPVEASPACRNRVPAPAWTLRQDERPDGDGVGDWREWMRDRYRRKVATGNFADKRNVLLSVWGEAERAYHFRKGMVPEPEFCAGCGARLSRADRVIVLLDGARVHSSNDCLDAYESDWRSEAKAALVAMGLNPPTMPAPDASK